MNTYDIINAGSNNRYMANGRIVSNSGRLLQLQNLAKNSISTLDEARDLIKMGAFEMVESIYGNTPDILSQLVRTMLIPKEGCEFIVADFSAIEARVLAWEADEVWRLESFKAGKDIYCESASQMFRVPVVKNGVNGHLRQKGKISELALGYQGSTGAMIKMGAIDMGLKETELPEIVDAWRTTNPNIVAYWWNMENAAIKTCQTREPNIVGKIMFSYSSGTLWMQLPSGRKLAYLKPSLQPNQYGRMALTFEGIGDNNHWQKQETYGGKLVENCISAGTEVLTSSGLKPIEQITEADLIWDGIEWVHHEGLIPKGVKTTIEVGDLHMTPEHKILTEKGWERADEAEGFNWASVSLPDGFEQNFGHSLRKDDGFRNLRAIRNKRNDTSLSTGTRMADRISLHHTGHAESVYDIRNCGPRHRFCVYDPKVGKLRIVSNCTQAIARDILAEAMLRMEKQGLEIVGSVHDEVIIEAPIGKYTVDEVCELMSVNPSWCKDAPLSAAGYKGMYYFKD